MGENVTIVEGKINPIELVPTETEFLKRLLGNIAVSPKDPDAVNSIVCIKSILEKLENVETISK